MPSPAPLLKLSRVGKSFGAHRVLDDVTLDLFGGEVHVLAGENGAGKSTLIKILAGIHLEYDGEIVFAGKPARFTGPHDANLRGISVIHQEMSLIESMSIAENIFLGREPATAGGLLLDRATLTRRALDLCRQLGLDFTADDLGRDTGEFSLSVKNRVEIAKALSFDARVIVMDEPTSALNSGEVEKLFTLVEGLRARGCAIVYISHKMEEIYRIADRITVLRDGKLIGTAPVKDCPQPVLLRWMIGRDLESFVPAHTTDTAAAPTAMQVRNLSVAPATTGRPPRVRSINFDVRAGEILGLAGLQGSGASEVLQGIFGAFGDACSGDIALDGKPYTPDNPRDAIARGLALLTGDRKGTGLVLGLSVGENLTLAALPRLSPGGLLNPKKERAAANEDVGAFRIKTHTLEQPVSTLSGGNQQKIVLAKWLRTAPRVILMEEPTRGVDIGAKHEIYEMMNTWTKRGMAIVMVSTEMPEMLRLCDRILVMHRGDITAEFTRAEATPEKILAAAMGMTARHDAP